MLNLLNRLFKMECFCLILLACSVVIYTAAEATEEIVQKELSPREIILHNQIEQERQQEEKQYRERQTQLEQEQQTQTNQQRQEWQRRQS